MHRDYLFFSKYDRLALLLLGGAALVLLTLLITRGRQGSPLTAPPEEQAGDTVERRADDVAPQPAATLHPQPFDPNTVSFNQLRDMGFTAPMAINLIKWREAGKVFRIPQEVLLIHGWEDLDWQLLEPHVTIDPRFRLHPRRSAMSTESDPSRRAQATMQRKDGLNYDSIVSANPYLTTKFTEFTLVDLNAADSAEILRVPGIGPYYAERIIHHRARLGGFISSDQLLDISNFPESALEWFTVSDPHPRKINLLTASAQTLYSHPYIGSRKARAIEQWQRLYGPITTLSQLRETGIFTPEEMERLVPYLELEE